MDSSKNTIGAVEACRNQGPTHADLGDWRVIGASTMRGPASADIAHPYARLPDALSSLVLAVPERLRALRFPVRFIWTVLPQGKRHVIPYSFAGEA